MKNSVSFRLLSLMAIVLMGFTHAGFSQSAKSGEFIVEGKVNNPQGEKAVGATILVKGTTIGTVTDTTGHFTLKVPSAQSILVIRHFSTTQAAEISVDGKSKHIVRLASDPGTQSSTGDFQDNHEVFDRVEENPRPASGDNGWYAYLSKNVKYAQNDRETGVEGTVIVGFEIHADGTVQNVEVLRGIGGEGDQEAVRVIAAGPNWKPGIIGGVAVNTRMSMPIQFKLSGSTTSDSQADAWEGGIANLYGANKVVVIGYLPQANR